MSWLQIDPSVLSQVVSSQERCFSTRDVSEDPRMSQAHAGLAGHSHFHAFVGRALSEHGDALRIKKDRNSGSRGSVWQKCGAGAVVATGPQSDATAGAVAVPPAISDYGPQYAKDSRFAKRMRWHQSWYRAVVLKLACGTGPKSTDTTCYGNMLTRSDGEAGRNFLNAQIAEIARCRVQQRSGRIDSFRLRHNMQASTPMCFNLFGPLVTDGVLARRLISAVLGKALSEVIRVELEWAPSPRGKFLNDGTSFDAFVEYRTEDGRLHILGIETKLTEPFSPDVPDRDSYRRWMRIPGAPWRSDADRDVQKKIHNQLWRDHLLAFSMVHQPSSPYASGRLMVVRHPLDVGCGRTIAGYKQLLKEEHQDQVVDMKLDRIVDLWTPLLSTTRDIEWIKSFRLRYLDLALSERRS